MLALGALAGFLGAAVDFDAGRQVGQADAHEFVEREIEARRARFARFHHGG
ncbi:hypothetical protein D3C83_194830 [compost metagenome]